MSFSNYFFNLAIALVQIEGITLLLLVLMMISLVSGFLYLRLRKKRIIKNLSLPASSPIPTPISITRRPERQVPQNSFAFLKKIESILTNSSNRTQDQLQRIEEILLQADVGIQATEKIIEKLKNNHQSLVSQEFRKELVAILSPAPATPRSSSNAKPQIIMFVGVNGVGKTSTAGKLGQYLINQGKKILIAAADTFRAAAIEQIEIWGQRINADIIKQSPGSDPAAVAFDACTAAKARNIDVLLIDTAGRLHNKTNLMEELKKIKRSILKQVPPQNLQIILVLDASTGQNGIQQVIQFHQALNIDAIILTKLDGTAKGGILFSICEQYKIPVKMIGTGEGIHDLEDFNPEKFISALF